MGRRPAVGTGDGSKPRTPLGTASVLLKKRCLIEILDGFSNESLMGDWCLIGF